MITNLPGYGSRSLNNPKLAKVKVEDTRGQAQFVHVPTQGRSVPAGCHGTAHACSCADAAERPRVQEQATHTPARPSFGWDSNLPRACVTSTEPLGLPEP